MPDVKMTRKQFFEEYKKAVAAYEGSKCAEEWLALANTVTDEDFVNGDEVIAIDADDMRRLSRSANNGGALGANDELSVYFGLSRSKQAEFSSLGYRNAQNGLDGVVSMAVGTIYDNIAEFDKNAAQTEFRRGDNVYELNGMIRDVFAACDDLDIVDNKYTLKFYDLSAKNEKKLNAKEVNDMLAEGKVVYARHDGFGDIPLVKDADGKIVSGDKLLNRPAYEPKKTEIPKVKGFWNNICRLLHIRTSGTRVYFEAKDLEKARRAEADKKNAELEKAKAHIRKDPKFETGKVMNINEEIEKQNAKAKKDPENQITEKAKIAAADMEKWQAGLKEAFESEGYSGKVTLYGDEDRRLELDPESANTYLKRGKTLYAACGKSGTYKFNLLGEKSTLLFGDKAASAEDVEKAKLSEEIKKYAMNKVVENVRDLFVFANGVPKRRHGENNRAWQEKAYIKLSTDEEFQFKNFSAYKKDNYVDLFDHWLGQHRDTVVDAYRAACEKEHKGISETAVNYLSKELNGSKLFDFIEAKQNEHIVKYANPEREKKLQAILAEQKEKKESYKAKETEKSLKGQKIVDEKKSAAYEVIMDFENVHTDTEVLDALATVIVCHTLTPKTGYETDVIAGNNVEMRRNIEESRAQGIKAREIISGNENAFQNAVDKVKGSEGFRYYANEYKNAMAVKAQNGKAKSFFVAKKAVMMSKKMLEEHNIGGNLEPLKAGVLAAESQLIIGLDEKSKELSLGVSDIVKDAISKSSAASEKEKNEINAPSLGELEKK